MKIDTDIIKSLVLENWTYIVILVLSFFLFKSCDRGKELSIANRNLQYEKKELIASADKYAEKVNELNGKIVLLEQLKQKVKVETVYIQNKTKSDVEKVATLNTKQIGKYYQERYKLPITITQYGVSLSDTIAKKNIAELIQKDGCFQEVALFKTQLQIEEKKGIFKDTIIENITKANIDLRKAVFTQDKIIENTEKAFKKERNKKTFWQVTSTVIAAGAGYLLITK